MADLLIPENPQTENNNIENNTHGVPVHKFPVCGPFTHKYSQNNYSEYIGQVNDDNSGRNKPEFVFPGSRE